MSTCLMCHTELPDPKARWCPNCGVHLGIYITRADKTLNAPTKSCYAAVGRWYRNAEYARKAEERS